MSELAKLREEHSQIMMIVRALEVLISRPGPPPQLDLFAIRRDLSAVLIAHLKAEDWALYPRLLASRDPRIAATARRFSKEMGGLAASYAGYSEKWHASAIGADWPGNCRESRELFDALGNRIARENRELYPLLEKLDRAA